MDMLDMSEKLDRADKQELRSFLSRADDCTANRNFSCSESNIERAAKLAKDSADKKLLESSRLKITTEKQLIAREAKEAEEQMRLAEESRQRREDEEDRQLAQSNYNNSSGNSASWNNYFQQQLRNNQNVLSQLNNQQRQVEDLKRQEYQRQLAQEQSRRERAQQEERERQRQQQMQREARDRAEQAEREKQRQQQAQKEARDRAEQAERERQSQIQAQRDELEKERQTRVAQLAGQNATKQLAQASPSISPGEESGGKIVDQTWNNSGVGKFQGTECAKMETQLRHGFEGGCKDIRLISVGECKCNSDPVLKGWECSLQYRMWKARDIVCGER